MAAPGSGTGLEVPGSVSSPTAPAPSGNVGVGSGFEVPGGAAPAAKGGGGFLSSIGHDLGAAGHFVSTRLATGASTIKSIGTGLYDAADAGLYRPWESFLTTGHPYAKNIGAGVDKATSAALGGTIIGPVNAAKDIASGKFKDPIGDLVMLSPALHGVARAGFGASDAAAALRAGEGGKAAVGALRNPSLLQKPRFISEPGRRPVSLYASQNAARRLVQAGIDKATNHALANERASGLLGHEGPVAAYGRSRMGGTLADIGRSRIRFRQAMIASTRIAGRQVDKFAKSLGQDVENPQLVSQALLHSLHDNQLPEHEAIFHEQQAAKGVGVEQNTDWAKAFSDAAKLGVVHLDGADRVVIDETHPLAPSISRADSALEKIGAYGEEQLVARGLRDPVALADRNARVSQLVQRGEPLRGKEPQALSDARRGLVKAQSAHQDNLQSEADWRAGEGQKSMEGQRVSPGPNLTLGGKAVEGTPEAANPWRDKVVASGQKLEAAQQRVQQFEDRYGYSSPERRDAIAKGMAAREQLSAATHSLFPPEVAAEKLSHIEQVAQQWARANDATPHEFYANHMTSEDVPQTIANEGFDAARKSLNPVLEEVARREYTQGLSSWTPEAEKAFVEDMLKASRGEPVSPLAQRLYNMTSHYIEGRGYVPMTVWEDVRQSHSPMASATGKVVGETTDPMNKHLATGEAMAQGMRRTDVGESVTAHWQKIMRFFNTLDHRELAAQHGSDTRLSSDDVLVREDRRTEAGMKIPASKIGPTIKEALDILENKTRLPEPEEEGLGAGVNEAMREIIGHIFPRLGTDPELIRIEQTAERGTPAPAGYKWVPEQVAKLKDLQSAMAGEDSNVVGRFADNINGAVTAATVYYKIGHLTTREMTNATANILQGSARPTEIAKSVDVWRKLTKDEQQEALAYAGTHYYEAAPGATGSTFVGKGMQKGLHIPFTDKALRTKAGVAVMSPQWWAHNIDAPFRFNSIAFEARKAGYEGVDGFRCFLSDVRDYNQLDNVKRAEVDGVLRRGDREAIAYDRLNHFEKRFLARAIWFYPWVKGSTVFTANTLFEHPFKAAALYGYGEQGSQERDKVLGDLPSYAQGLTPLTHGASPVVTDLNTFNPFSTAADLMQIPAHLGNAGGMLNPAYGAAVGAAEGVNPYGAHTPSPILDNIKGLFSSAPEYQIVNSLLDHGDQSHRLYPGGHGLSPLYKNWLGELVRALGGPAMPRHVNPDSGHSLAQRERTGR